MTSIGGQALLEGIMMKGPHKTVMATRLPDKTIDIEQLHEKHAKDKFKPFGWPIIRGSVNMIESLIMGYKALMKSAEKLGIDEDDEEVKDSWLYKVFGEKLMAAVGAVAGVLGRGSCAGAFYVASDGYIQPCKRHCHPIGGGFLPHKGGGKRRARFLEGCF